MNTHTKFVIQIATSNKMEKKSMGTMDRVNQQQVEKRWTGG